MTLKIGDTAPDFEADTSEGRISFHDLIQTDDHQWWARAIEETQGTAPNYPIIGDSDFQLILIYPMTTGRNFDEVLRVIDSLQLTANHKVATPAQWKPGDDVIIAGSVSNDQAKEIFGEWASPKPYIRIVPQPR